MWEKLNSKIRSYNHYLCSQELQQDTVCNHICAKSRHAKQLQRPHHLPVAHTHLTVDTGRGLMPENPFYPPAPFFSYALWTSFQLSLQPWTYGLFTWLVTNFSPFGAFFSFSAFLTILEMDGNYSNTEKYHSKFKSAQQLSLITSTSITPRLHLQPLCCGLVQCKTISSGAAAKIPWSASAQNPVPHTGS